MNKNIKIMERNQANTILYQVFKIHLLCYACPLYKFAAMIVVKSAFTDSFYPFCMV